jgi:hypothetical protein
MLYDEMKEKYPGKEIKLVPKEYENQYKKWGFITIEECTQAAFNKNFQYCFMVEK